MRRNRGVGILRLLVAGLAVVGSLALMGAKLVPKVHEYQAPAARSDAAATPASDRERTPSPGSSASDLEGPWLIAMADSSFQFFEASPAKSGADPRPTAASQSVVRSTSADDGAPFPRPGPWSGALATFLLCLFFLVRRIN